MLKLGYATVIEENAAKYLKNEDLVEVEYISSGIRYWNVFSYLMICLRAKSFSWANVVKFGLRRGAM